jgi:hypothetical protein
MNDLFRRLIAAGVIGIIVAAFQALLWTGWQIESLLTVFVVGLAFFLVPYLQEDLSRLQSVLALLVFLGLPGCGDPDPQPGEVWEHKMEEYRVEVRSIGSCSGLSEGKRERYESVADSVGVQNPYSDPVTIIGGPMPLALHESGDDCLSIVGKFQSGEKQGHRWLQVVPSDTVAKYYHKVHEY